MTHSKTQLSSGGIASLVCLLEVAAPKPGNVHRAADFEDVTFEDFATSAVVLGQVIDASEDLSLGDTILAAVTQTNTVVGTNTNLGIVLLLVPLAKLASRSDVELLDQSVVQEFLGELPKSTGAKVFEAIRLANPGGLGESDQMDVQSSAGSEVDLLAAMELAKDRDAIALQYVTGYRKIFELGVPLLVRGRAMFESLSHAIVYAHVALMADQADSLIERKCGADIANNSQTLAARAHDILDADAPTQDQLESYWAAVGELDFWLRSDGHRRNPGTTADLIAASLFVAVYNGVIEPPFR